MMSFQTKLKNENFVYNRQQKRFYFTAKCIKLLKNFEKQIWSRVLENYALTEILLKIVWKALATLSTTFKISLYITYVGNCFSLLTIDDYAILLLSKMSISNVCTKRFFQKLKRQILTRQELSQLYVTM